MWKPYLKKQKHQKLKSALFVFQSMWHLQFVPTIRLSYSAFLRVGSLLFKCLSTHFKWNFGGPYLNLS